ncbi:MAG: N-acetyl-gamma-glutamyl-phosphate reductase [Pseudomonadota bacterium]
MSADTATPATATSKPQTVFIDGQAGTTGLDVASRLADVDGLTIVEISEQDRKNADAKRALLRDVDLVVLCLPDDAARETVAMADGLANGGPVIVDASTAHRVADGWTYGFAELSRGQAQAIRESQRIANPGCYPTGAIALIRPLVDAGLIPPGQAITINAVSGYSGGGRQMIAAYDSGEVPPFELYGLGLAHKHLPELQRYASLARPPIFVPSVGNFRQGMLVSIPLFLDTLPVRPSASDLRSALADHYEATAITADRTVRVATSDDAEASAKRLAADTLAGTGALELFVFGNADETQAVLVARLDNLGKGAAGAAVQNIRLALGLL